MSLSFLSYLSHLIQEINYSLKSVCLESEWNFLIQLICIFTWIISIEFNASSLFCLALLSFTLNSFYFFFFSFHLRPKTPTRTINSSTFIIKFNEKKVEKMCCFIKFAMETEAVWITTKKFSERKKERIQKFYEKRGRPQGKLVLFEIKVWMKEYENIREGWWKFLFCYVCVSILAKILLVM